MPEYGYRCNTCGEVSWFKHSMEDERYHYCCGELMDRHYVMPNVTIIYDTRTYIERAMEGKEEVPGMTKEQVRKVAGTFT